jgi:hypothetical protein
MGDDAPRLRWHRLHGLSSEVKASIDGGLTKLLASTVDAGPIREDATPEDKERIFHSRIPVGLSPFSIPGIGRLRVRAHYSDGSILKMGSIAVRQASVEEFNKLLMTGVLPQQN